MMLAGHHQPLHKLAGAFSVWKADWQRSVIHRQEMRSYDSSSDAPTPFPARAKIAFLPTATSLAITLFWPLPGTAWAHQRDRKSTRLNSSHTVISYAVFC